MKTRYDYRTGVTKIKTNTKKYIMAGIASLLIMGGIALPALAAGGGGFDQYGYNNQARNFVGTGGSWCAAKGYGSDCAGYPVMRGYAKDKLVMKWNAAWDACNDSDFDPSQCVGATLTNEWNGKVPGGSGETEHFKAVWVGSEKCAQIDNGGNCIWGQYEAIMDFYSGEHNVLAKALPAGFGAYK